VQKPLSGFVCTDRICLQSSQGDPYGGSARRSMVHFFALVLWVAGGLAILAGMPQLGLAIFVVIVLNGIFAFVQEHRAERASEKRRDLLPRRATVLRDGIPVEINASDLVVDDIVLLQAGDRISADLRLFEAFALSVDTSMLTGESEPVSAGIGDAVMAGTFVVEGQGRGTVTATGKETRLASLVQLTQASHRPRTPLAEELDRVVRAISIAALVAELYF
jgi:P-type E1-E2 ATPase